MAIEVGQARVLRACAEVVGVEMGWTGKKCKTYKETVMLPGD